MMAQEQELRARLAARPDDGQALAALWRLASAAGHQQAMAALQAHAVRLWGQAAATHLIQAEAHLAAGRLIDAIGALDQGGTGSLSWGLDLKEQVFERLKMSQGPAQAAYQRDSTAVTMVDRTFLTVQQCEQVIALAGLLPEIEATLADGGYSTDIRRSQVRFLPLGPLTEWLYLKVMAAAARIAGGHYRYQITEMEPMQLGTYHENSLGHYDWHPDGYIHSTAPLTRKLSLSVQLSDPASYDGGDLELHYESKPMMAARDQGAAIFFPSPVVHRVAPVTRGVRHSLVAWFLGPPFI